MQPLSSIPPRPLVAVALALLAGCGGEAPSGAGGAAADPPSAFGEERPSTAEVLYRRGRDLARQGDGAGALDYYRQAVAADPTMAQAHFALGTALVPTASGGALGSSTKDHAVLDEALEHMRVALEADPDNAEYAYWTGRALDLRGKEAEAVAMLERAIALLPSYGLAYKRLGMVHHELGDVEGARAAWVQALPHLPHDGGVRFMLGNLDLEGDPEQAKAYFEDAIAVAPTFAKAYFGLSQVLVQLGDEEGAKAAREKFGRFQAHTQTLQELMRRARENPRDVAAQLEAADMAFLLLRDEDATEMFTRVLRLDTRNVQAHFRMGQLQLRAGNLERAVQHFEECAFLDANLLAAKFELLSICIDTEDDVRIAELKEQIAPQLRSAEDHATFGELLARAGQAAEARSHLEKALELDPAVPGAAEALARLDGEG